MCAVSLSMPYVGIKIANGFLLFMYRPIIQFNGFVKESCISSKGVLPTLGARGKHFPLDNLCRVKLCVYVPHSTFSSTILSVMPTSVWGTVYIPWTFVSSFSHIFLFIFTNIEYVVFFLSFKFYQLEIMNRNMFLYCIGAKQMYLQMPSNRKLRSFLSLDCF